MERERFPDLLAGSGAASKPSSSPPKPNQPQTAPTAPTAPSSRTRRRSTLTPEQVATSVQSFRELSGLAPETEKVDKELAEMSLNNSNNPNMFSNFLDNNAPRAPPSPSPTPQHQMNPINGGGMAPAGVAMPMSAGHQMDIAHLYRVVDELSGVLRHNRDMTQSIIRASEDLAVSHYRSWEVP